MSSKKELRDKAKYMEPVARIGKNGMTHNILDEIRKNLKAKKLVKVRFLRSFVEDKDRKQCANEVAEKTRSELIDVVGNVVVLYKR